MPLTTTLNANLLDQPTGDAELDDLLEKVRAITDRDYQIVTRTHTYTVRRWWVITRQESYTDVQLYVDVAGFPPWQELTCARGKREIFAYLFGVLNGVRAAKAKGEA